MVLLILSLNDSRGWPWRAGQCNWAAHSGTSQTCRTRRTPSASSYDSSSETWRAAGNVSLKDIRHIPKKNTNHMLIIKLKYFTLITHDPLVLIKERDRWAVYLFKSFHSGCLFVVIHSNIQWLLLEGDARKILHLTCLCCWKQHGLSLF